ncbi:GDP-mannose 4,6-dehydratase [uncultured archaeon]|nr:GDP-mannose 4,6-dehydratase [uncultured archaeon]
MATKKALISGITGQDGSYLTELLLEKNYDVFGIVRVKSKFDAERIEYFKKTPSALSRLHLIYGDLTDSEFIKKTIKEIQPDEFYNLGAQSSIKESFNSPEYTCDSAGMGTLHCLEAIRIHSPRTRFYQASSSEMFGKVTETPQKETTPFNPRSPYACAKVFGYWITKNYREAFHIFASNGILFNHDSPRRGENFVTRKITLAAARIKHGLQDKLYLGNLDAKRDWGYAKEYVEAMWMLLQQKEPDDFVIATGETHSVQEFLESAFSYAGLDWKKYVEIDSNNFRPTEVDMVMGDASKAKRVLGWEPKTTFKELVKIMVDADMRLIEAEAQDKKK